MATVYDLSAGRHLQFTFSKKGRETFLLLARQYTKGFSPAPGQFDLSLLQTE